MMKNILKLILISISFQSFGQQLPPNLTKWTFDGTVLRKYYLIDGDEFNSNNFDNKKWANAFDWGRSLCADGVNEIHYCTDGDNIDINTYGKLKLVAKNDGIWASAIGYEPTNFVLCDGGQNYRYFNYTSGMLFSKRKYRYGLFEINTQLPPGQGMFPAFWLFEYDDQPSDPGADEIDIFEAKGECPYYLHFDLHPTDGVTLQNPWNNANVGDYFLFSGPFTQSYNTIRAVWEPGGFVQWSVNSSLAYESWPLNYTTRMTMIANLQLGKTSQTSNCPAPFSDGPNAGTVFPASMDIEFIRIWKPLDCSNNVTICNYPNGLVDDESITGETVQIGSNTCSNNIVTFVNGISLDIAAISEINFVGETTIEGAMYARIVDCPYPVQNRIQDLTSSNFIDGNEFDENGNVALGSDFANIDLHKNEVIDYIISPNPSTGKFIIHFFDYSLNPEQVNINFELRNSIGQNVSFKYNIIDGKLHINLEQQKSGLYFLRVQMQNKSWILKLNKQI